MKAANQLPRFCLSHFLKDQETVAQLTSKIFKTHWIFFTHRGLFSSAKAVKPFLNIPVVVIGL